MWAGDWALKRILKFVLKRSLRNVIKTRIDLDQLNVALGQGTLELKEVLLNERYLNEQLVRPLLFTGWDQLQVVPLQYADVLCLLKCNRPGSVLAVCLKGKPCILQL